MTVKAETANVGGQGVSVAAIYCDGKTTAADAVGGGSRGRCNALHNSHVLRHIFIGMRKFYLPQKKPNDL